ncbi:MAG: hypothetical protein BIP78_0278 [Candidatus Bipolaricaulis sibiricus]|uniref:PKD domain-containing protein n=1 Tax=Bipolaricaulis sibiricus TaxID=2501609 RepID=A0A410FSQ7_BIPS1|nr:MAG: hypothetical protein BIP78_0278 [Candidatus Bipolaricaulis sibiricus]
MIGRVVLGLVLVAMGTGCAQGSPPTPLGIADLERVLSDWRLGCGGCPGRWNWDGRQLAGFVAGRLAALGFQAELAREGEEWWVLVGTLVEGEAVTVPVLPGLPPLDRDGQFTRGVFLGRVAWAKPGQPDPKYLAPEEVWALPANASPSVRLRIHPTEAAVGEAVGFNADVTDSDGYVVLVVWEFGDGEGSWFWTPEHVYDHPGVYTVTVTVVDNDGGTSQARATVVVSEAAASPPGGGGGCGCGR